MVVEEVVLVEVEVVLVEVEVVLVEVVMVAALLEEEASQSENCCQQSIIHVVQ